MINKNKTIAARCTSPQSSILTPQSSTKAIALISGGLDSLLAAKTVMDQGIHVEGINFYSSFFGVGSKTITLRKNQKNTQYNSAKWVAEQLGIKLHVVDAFETFKTILLHPKYGYGKNINPCLDCKVFIVKEALKWIQANDFDFIISGEVIGQRPMSQRKDTMPIVAKQSGANDLILRPLCAKLLPPTKPELEGWIDREKLLDFSGRDRKPQITLAKELGFENFPQPAGGCLLTEPGFCARLNDLWQSRDTKDYSRTDIELLKIGRHIRPKRNFKLIIAREDTENDFLEKYTDQYTHLYCVDVPGPLALIDGKVTNEDLHFAARIISRFTKHHDKETVKAMIYPLNKAPFETSVTPIRPEEIPTAWYI